MKKPANCRAFQVNLLREFWSGGLMVGLLKKLLLVCLVAGGFGCRATMIP